MVRVAKRGSGKREKGGSGVNASRAMVTFKCMLTSIYYENKAKEKQSL